MSTLRTYTVLHKGRITTSVKGALSHTYADEDVYDGTNFRNELDASYLGREWATVAIAWATPPATGQVAEASDDRLRNVDPHNELKKRTKLIIWSGAAGTGDVLFEGWADRIESFSIGEYQTL